MKQPRRTLSLAVATVSALAVAGALFATPAHAASHELHFSSTAPTKAQAYQNVIDDMNLFAVTTNKTCQEFSVRYGTGSDRNGTTVWTANLKAICS